MIEDEISRKNSLYWEELCGTHLATVLGIEGVDEDSLKIFDEWYFRMYPYLFDHIPLREMAKKNVLEVGLGFGSVSQKIAESGANYSGLDIASKASWMANHRLALQGLNGKAVVGSVLDAPFPDGSFDYIVTIGCLHHTGDLQKAIDECYRMLRDGGTLVLMLYYAYSARRWYQNPRETSRYLLSELLGYRGVVHRQDTRDRYLYDHNADGEAAPHTDFVSIKSLRKMGSKFSSFTCRIENIMPEPPLGRWIKEREKHLGDRFVRTLGLDIYATLKK
mgnify:CR=1 FL=1